MIHSLSGFSCSGRNSAFDIPQSSNPSSSAFSLMSFDISFFSIKFQASSSVNSYQLPVIYHCIFVSLYLYILNNCIFYLLVPHLIISYLFFVNFNQTVDSAYLILFPRGVNRPVLLLPCLVESVPGNLPG